MDTLNPLILIISDVHLGALKSNLVQFSLFLDKIETGKFGKKLQVLIILGDFLDLCTSVENALFMDEKITRILDQLLELKKKVKVIFVPGNHEIPITSSVLSGSYDEKFKRRKEKFLEKFRNTIVEHLFKSDEISQYIILSKLKRDSCLLLFESQDQIFNKPIRKIKIKNLDLEDNYNCLMVHGYQFDSDVFRFFVGPIWKSLISYHNFEVKEAYNYFWNEIIKENRKIKKITLDDMKSDLIRLKHLPPEAIDILFSELSSLEFNIVKLNMRIMKKWENAKDTRYYINGINEFFDEVECDLTMINHIIYGHSHIKGISYEIILNNETEVVNDGAWQHTEPSYVEIHKGGKIILK
ncbi:MAG: metallophosphoesterase [Candidatus Thorarchaeota archaeon]